MFVCSAGASAPAEHTNIENTLGEAEDLAALAGYDDGVFELCGPAAVSRPYGPSVWIDFYPGGFLYQDGFNGNNQSFWHDGAGSGAADAGHVWRFVHGMAKAM